MAPPAQPCCKKITFSSKLINDCLSKAVKKIASIQSNGSLQKIEAKNCVVTTLFNFKI